MSERTATKLSSRDDGLTINARYMRAQQMTAHVMHVIGKYITDEENDHYREAARALLDLFYDNGVQVYTLRTCTRTETHDIRFRWRIMAFIGGIAESAGTAADAYSLLFPEHTRAPSTGVAYWVQA